MLGGHLECPRALGHLALEPADQLLQMRGDRVEGRGKGAKLVASLELDALVIGARADRLGGHLQALDRAHQPAGKQDRERDRGQDEGGDDQRRSPDLSAQGGEGG